MIRFRRESTGKRCDGSIWNPERLVEENCKNLAEYVRETCDDEDCPRLYCGKCKAAA